MLNFVPPAVTNARKDVKYERKLRSGGEIRAEERKRRKETQEETLRYAEEFHFMEF